MRANQEGVVKDWDDPRLPTICRPKKKRLYPRSLRNFVDAAGVAKRENVIDMSF